MARALDKVHKKISKKRGGKSNTLHENSRDAQRLRSAGAREEKLQRVMDAATRSNRVYGMLTLREFLCTGADQDAHTVDRVAWFKSALEGSVGALSEEEMHLLTQRYDWVITVGCCF
jgi:translation machinery-associated protein 16